MKFKNLLKPLLFIGLLIGTVYLTLRYGHYLSLESLKASQQEFQIQIQESPGKIELIFFLIYVISTAISIPGAAILTLAGGAFFGFTKGLILVSFASTIGATGSFLIARYFFRDWFVEKFASTARKIDDGFQKEGTSYLISLRLIPLFPFFAVNSLMGLTSISALKFYFVSQLAMLPGTAIYVWAGLEIGQLNSLNDIVSPSFLLASTMLGVLPYILKKLLHLFNKHKAYSQFKKPKKFEYNLVVIGAGAAGLVSTAIARAVKAKVALVEKHKMGGDCLNFGCVPSKALIHLSQTSSQLTYEELQKKVQGVIAQIAPHDSVERFQGLGADVFKGDAKIISPYEVEVNGKVLTTKNIILATGAEPIIPNLNGINLIQPLTSETLWDIQQLPKKLLIIGGGPIGCELAMAFQRLGSRVTLIEKGTRILSKEIPEASELIENSLLSLGVRVLKQTEIQEIKTQNQAILKSIQNEKEEVIDFDQILFAIGRKPRVLGFGLEKLGLITDGQTKIQHNEFLETKFPNIYVCGDVVSPLQLTHMAGHQAWYASVNALFGTFRKFKQDLRVIPKVTFTSPQVASVGLNKIDAADQSLKFEVTHYSLGRFDRALCDQANQGFIEILTKKGTDQILGVTIVAEHAGELLSEYTLAMKWNLGLKKILATVHAYPTWSDANKLAALEWQRARVPHKLLKIAEFIHNWRRR